MPNHKEQAFLFAGRVKALGFRVFIAKSGEYGFVTDDAGSRVLCFGFSNGGELSGNYGPPSTTSGTGWRINKSPYDLQTAADVRDALYAHAPQRTERTETKGWRYYTTLEQHLKMYGDSSRYVEV
jgi:hypothetical protein